MALVQLFAIAAASSGNTDPAAAKLILESYLRDHLSSRELEEYLKLYEELIFFHTPPDPEEVLNPEEKIRVMSQKVARGLPYRDRLMVFIRFVEFTETMHDESLGASLRVLQQSFTLTENDYLNAFSFVTDPHGGGLDPGRFLVIDNTPGDTLKYYHLRRERLEGKILILLFPEERLLVGRYSGTDPLYLNGRNILPERAFILAQGTILNNPKISPVYYQEVASMFIKAQQVALLEFTAREMEYRFPGSDNGIHPFSFTASSGELIGIMGGSGVGKSTFLNLCNGNLPLQGGEILINGHSLSGEKDKRKGVIGFIPQDDLLMEELTVFQNLWFNARLCLSDLSDWQINRAVLKVLQDIGLNGIRDLRVGDPLNKFISGGQRKRLNIALELIREPSILFVDEPTSGLSSLDSEMVMLLLKEQTLKGRLVVVNIHQPSSDIFKIFDALLILDKGGYPIYYGNPVEAVTWFKHISNHVNPDESECLSCGYVNPEQILQIAEARTVSEYGRTTSNRKISPAEWYDYFRKQIQPAIPLKSDRRALPPSRFHIPGKLKQLGIFGQRTLLSRITNTQYLLINLLEAPLLAAILAYLTRWFQGDTYQFSSNPNLVAYLFMSVVVALFIGMMVSAEEIFRDRRILKREAFLNLSRNSYLLSKIIFLLVLSAIQTALYVWIGNWILGIRGMMFSYWLVLFSTAFFANMVGLNISAGLDSIVAIYILIPFILVPQLLLSGTVVPFDKLNPSIASQERVPVVGNLMTSRWAYEALAVEQFRNNRYQKPFFEYDRQISYYNYITAFRLPQMHSMLDECRRNLVKNTNPDKTSRKLAILRYEFSDLMSEAGFGKVPFTEDLQPARFTDSIRNIANIWLDSASCVFSKRLSQWNHRRDAHYTALEKEMGSDGLLGFRSKYYNDNLADFVTDRNGLTKITEGHGRLVRKKDPVFMEPVYRNGNAHFYAPEKILGNLYIETFWFNIAVIWIFSGLLYVLLITDGIRRLTSLANKRKIFSR